MKKTLAALAAGLLLMLTFVGASGAPAYAYPPGTKLTITTTPLPEHAGRTSFVVTITNAKPGCKVRVFIDDKRHTTVADTSGSGQVTFTLHAAAGLVKVRAKTFACTYKEKASTDVYIDGYKVSGPQSVTAHAPFSVHADDFRAHTHITVLAIHDGRVVQVKGTTDSHGRFTAHFRLSKGTWAIIATAGGHAATTKIKVT